jgi:hypothetical protein
MRNAPENIFTEKSKRTFYVQELFSENRAFYEIMWKNML